MTLTATQEVSSASAKGLNTDGNAMGSVAETNIAEANYELLRDGTRKRRRPFMEEHGRSDQEGAKSTNGISCHIWEIPDFEQETSILAEERNREVRFYRIDHRTPAYMRENELVDVLRLELFGNWLDSDTEKGNAPCTYTEGNGCLYIFHPHSGTIRVELVDNERLLFAPVGTWIRDYHVAEENISAHTREMDRIPAERDEYAPGDAYATRQPGDREVLEITDQLSAARGYNLSNTGWTGEFIAQYRDQTDGAYQILDAQKMYGNLPGGAGESVNRQMEILLREFPLDTRGVYPALTDRYTDGIAMTPNGDQIFSRGKIEEARHNTSTPLLGARIGHSHIRPAGTLVSEPERITPTNVSIVGAAITMDLTFSHRVWHTDARPLSEYAAFLHMVRFTAEEGGITYQGGVSKVVDAQPIGFAGRTLRVSVVMLELLNGYSNVQVTEVLAHPSPEYFAHQVLLDTDFREEPAGSYPTCGAFWAGRLWQANDSQGLVYFSQTVERASASDGRVNKLNESLCFQRADPTDNIDGALVATDGGFIHVPEAGNVVGMQVFGNSLLLLTDRGVWAISPGEEGYFTPGAYRISKVSNTEVLGSRAYVEVADELHIASDQGVWVMTGDGAGSITDGVIRQQWETTLEQNREVVGAYDPDTDVVRWIFPQDRKVEPIERPIGTEMLTFDRRHQAWTRYVTEDGTIFEDIVVMPYTANTETYNNFRYLVSSPNFDVFTIPFNRLCDYAVEVEFGADGVGKWVTAHDKNERFADFVRIGSPLREAPEAFMITNHLNLGNHLRFGQIIYLVSYNRNVTTAYIEELDNSLTENVPGSTLMQGLWDWSDGAEWGKFSPLQQTYRFRRPYFPTANTYERREPVIAAKSKVRGRGRELRIAWRSEGHNDSHIEGWAFSGLVLNGV